MEDYFGELQKSDAPSGIDWFSVIEGKDPDALEITPETLGTPGLEDLSTRFRMARGGNFQEKLEAFQKTYPQGDIFVREVGGTPTLLFRKDASDTPKKVDAGLLEKQELVADLVDFIGEDLGSIVGETAFTLFRSGGNAPLSLLQLGARLYAGSTIGDMAQEGIQSALGEQRETMSDIVRRANIKGGLSTIGGVTGEKIIRTGKNIFRGKGALSLKPGASKALAASRRLGVNPPPFNVLSDNPLIQLLGGQSRALLPRINRYVLDIKQSTARTLNMMRDLGVDSSANLNQKLQLLVNASRRKLLRESLDTLNIKPQRARTFAPKLADLIDKYDDFAKTQVDRLYAIARGIEEPAFDISDLQRIATELRAGVSGRTATGETTRLSPSSREFDAVLDKILSLDPSLPPTVQDGVVSTATDQLRAIQQTLYDMSFAAPGQIARAPELSARRVRGVIGKILNNPKNTTPEFRKAWKDAATAAGQRFDTLEKIVVTEARRTESPTMFVKRLISDGNVDNVVHIKKALGGNIGELRDVFVTEFLASPDTITKRLGALPREFVDQFIPRPMRGRLLELGAKFDEIGQAGIEKLLQSKTGHYEIIKKMVNTDNSIAVHLLNDLSKNNPEVRRSIRSSIIDYVVRESFQQTEGTKTISKNAISKVLKSLRKSGALRFLTVSDIKNLTSTNVVESFLAKMTDAGTSIQAASAAAGVRGLALDAYITVAEAFGVGRVMTNQKFIQFAAGSGRGAKLSRSAAIALMSSIATDMATESKNIDMTNQAFLLANEK